MAHSKRSQKARVIPFTQLSDRGNKAIRLFLSLLGEDFTEEEAWEEAGRLAFRQKLQLTEDDSCHLVSKQASSYTVTPGNGTMTKTAIKKTPAKKASSIKSADDSVLGKAELLAGDSIAVTVARALARIMKREGLSVEAFSKKHGINYRTVYRILDGDKPQTAGANIAKICELSGITEKELFSLGEASP